MQKQKLRQTALLLDACLMPALGTAFHQPSLCPSGRHHQHTDARAPRLQGPPAPGPPLSAPPRRAEHAGSCQPRPAPQSTVSQSIARSVERTVGGPTTSPPSPLPCQALRAELAGRGVLPWQRSARAGPLRSGDTRARLAQGPRELWVVQLLPGGGLG